MLKRKKSHDFSKISSPELDKLKQTDLHKFFKIQSPESSKRKSNIKSPQPRKKVNKDNQKLVSEQSENIKQSEMYEVPTSTRLKLAIQAQLNIKNAKQIEEPINFDLKKIYDEKNFNFKFNLADNNTSDEAQDIHIPNDKHAVRLFDTIIQVFSNPVNCTYFDKTELTTVLSILMLSLESQTILARLMKWKPGWHRIKKSAMSLGIKPENIIQSCELYNNNIFEKNLENEETSVILNLLHVSELKILCQRMKLPSSLSKPKLIEKLMEISRQTKSSFFTASSPSAALKKEVKAVFGECFRISNLTWMLIKKIITLHYPNHDYEATLSDIFRILMDVHFQTISYPEIPTERFPIFSNRKEFCDYMNAKQKLTDTIEALKNKEWQNLKNLGIFAHDQLIELLSSNSIQHTFDLPDHLHRFTPHYILAKIIWMSIEAFKKNEMQDIECAKKLLTTLINHSEILTSYRGRWYAELALIEMSYCKNLDASAEIVEKALLEKLSPVEIVEILDRARKLASRKNGISSEKKNAMTKLIEEREQDLLCSPKETIVEGQMMDYEITQRTKSIWKLDSGCENNVFANVEVVAMNYYLQNGFTKALHCEGRLPTTIFACLFWNEIYTISVPGAFVSDYQIAPLDLWSKNFYHNRQEFIEQRIEFIRNIDINTLSEIIHSNYLDYESYSSLINTNLFEDSKDLKDIICCLGTDGVLGICQSLIYNYRQMSAGFPDLIVWNPDQLTCRIVEVKGPGDALSTKQKLWIKRLQELKIDVEVCLVKTK